MSIEMMTLVWRRSKNKGSVLLMELAIADHANDQGTGAYPSIERLTRYARQCERNARYLLRKLESSKEVIITPGAGPKGTNTFTINIPLLKRHPDQIGTRKAGAKFAPLQNSAQGGQKKAKGGNPASRGGQNRANHKGQPVAPDPDPSKDPSVRSVKDPSSSAEPREKIRATVERHAQLMMMNFGIDELVALELAAMPHVDERYLEYWIEHHARHCQKMIDDETLKGLGPGFFVKHIRAKELPAPIAIKYREAERDRIHAQAGDKTYFKIKKARASANKPRPQKPWWETPEGE